MVSGCMIGVSCLIGLLFSEFGVGNSVLVCKRIGNNNQ
jgi:hypothetical protein